MSEQCPFCGAIFTVVEMCGGGICGACREPIDCPHCKKKIREERTTGWFKEILISSPDNSLSQFLGITDNEWEEMGAELNANTGNTGDMVYNYWFIVPDATSEDILEKTGWNIGQTISDIPTWIVETE
ncbi:hypothetical protein C0W80_05765 [Photobacterium leiognathi subsp. mandapamensis]|uniref:hypothetical protein n=1 Tax=Photobacterium leiognathi TaxID=553611 RepID=UPI000D16EACE|nr:hypothetical protein [Photobacterium leiognathi]PSV03683.1 hypothetical protein C0W80_05765 [Photobacterium leiognathi subsp. mandapamensis]